MVDRNERRLAATLSSGTLLIFRKLAHSYLMVDQVLRPYKERLLTPVAVVLRQVAPNTVTVSGLVLGLGAALSLFLGWPQLPIILWLLNRTLDGLDGEIARLTGRQSDWGGYLDILVDFVVYAAIPVSIAARSPEPFITLSTLFLLAIFYINTASWMFLAALLEKRGRGSISTGERTSVTMPSGLIEGAETIFFYALFCLFPAQAPYLFIVMSLLLIVTVVQRLLWAHKHLD